LWLYNIVRDGCLKHLRKGSGLGKNRSSEGLHPQLSMNDIILAETIQGVHEAINSLPSDFRVIFELLCVRGKSIEEISSDLQLSIDTIKSKKAHGMILLQKRFPEFKFD
jgi:DNA-directed RNA polymerase specialized sigma24 family protein